MDKDFVVFYSEVIDVAETQFQASCSGKEGQAFAQALYQEYLDAGAPKPVTSWLRQRLQGEFVSIFNPPKWVEKEPAWPFLNAKPMVFISQTSLPQNEITERNLTWDTELYVFGARVPASRGYSVEYKIVEQIKDFEGSGA